MLDRFSRSEIIFGREAMERLAKTHVAVFGIGGVGGHALEALIRSGIGAVDIIDNDKVCLTNLNRQIIALNSTIGMYKVDAAEQRMLDINPDCKITKRCEFYTPEAAENFDFTEYDYIIDAIDTVSGKISLAVNAEKCGTPIISSMGAGNKLDPTAFEVADIYQTSVCPLARVMRHELKRRGVKSLKVVYSKEQPVSPFESAVQISKEENPDSKRRALPGSNAFVPSVAGLIIAGEVIKDICFSRN
ncbi:MAG: tRNA threonylcarbamoyladenosine dehydratase [Oscillospiraceae bacterium]|nr:tRNA threonylcarbamoyladenosine dehydratase [Oscillospiraceae bacterium]